MKIRLLVFLNRSAEYPCFERIFDFCSDIKFPFEDIVDTQKVLFGIQCVVEFELS